MIFRKTILSFFFFLRKTIAEKAELDYSENVKTWRILYEELYNKVKPFQVSVCWADFPNT